MSSPHEPHIKFSGTANKNQRATVQSWTVMIHRRAIDTDIPENICDDIRQLPWSWAKARLLVDFEVVTPVSWPLSQRDETYGHHSVRPEKVYHTDSPVWLTVQYVLIFAVVLQLSGPFRCFSICFLTETSSVKNMVILGGRNTECWVPDSNCFPHKEHLIIPPNGNKMVEILIISSKT